MMHREQDIRDHLARATPVAKMCDILARKWNVCASAIRKQYEKIISGMRISDKEERETLRTTLMLRYEHLYVEAIKEGNVKHAAEILNLISKLSGLYLPEKEGQVEQPKLIVARQGDFSKSLSLVDEEEAKKG